MSYLEPPEDAPEQAKLSIVDYLRKYWFWIALICVIILLLPLFTPAAYFFWGLGSAKALFHDRLGIGESISTVFAVAFMFVYTLAIPYAARWLTHGRRNLKDIGIAFISVLFVFASKPLLTGLLESSFNAQTGEAQRCYSWRGETLTLSERGASGCGIDPVTGQKTSELTPDIAAILERQQHAPKPIAIDGSPVQFFDPASGRPIVWYDRAPDGSLELFNADGFNPSTGKRLKPITPDVVEAVERKINAHAPASPTPAAVDTSGVGVLVGAFSTRATAEAAWSRLAQQHSALSGVRHRIVEGKADIGTVFRLQAVTADATSARALCDRLKSGGQDCSVKN